MSKKWQFLIFRGTIPVGGLLTFAMFSLDNFLYGKPIFEAIHYFQLMLQAIFFMGIGTLIALYFWKKN